MICRCLKPAVAVAFAPGLLLPPPLSRCPPRPRPPLSSSSPPRFPTPPQSLCCRRVLQAPANPSAVMKDATTTSTATAAAAAGGPIPDALPAKRENPPSTIDDANADVQKKMMKMNKPESTASEDSGQAQQQLLRVVLDDALAKAPARGSQQAAGYDLSACEAAVVAGGGGRAVVRTGLRVAVPAGCYGRVAPRSGLAVREGIDVGAGVIDPDYRGQLAVVLFNFSDRPFHVKPGDRIAQLVLERIATPDVAVVSSLDDTHRADGAFGSTGLNDNQPS